MSKHRTHYFLPGYMTACGAESKGLRLMGSEDPDLVTCARCRNTVAYSVAPRVGS